MSYGGVKATLQGKVLLKRLLIQVENMQVEYNRSQRLPMYRVEGEWLLKPALDAHGLGSSMHNPQTMAVGMVVSQEMHRLLTAELTREHNLKEVYELEIRTIKVNLESHASYRHDRKHTFPIEIEGFGYHSKVSNKPSDFLTLQDAGPVTCAILRDILMQHLGVDIGEYPRADR